MYSVVFSGISVSAAQDFFEFLPADDIPIALHSVSITQDTSETSEQLPFTIKRLPATVTSGTGGAAVTPAPLASSDAAASFAAERNNTSRATTSGTALTIRRRGENILNGVHWLFTPEERPVFKQTEACIIGLETAPGSALTMSGEAIVEELF